MNGIGGYQVTFKDEVALLELDPGEKKVNILATDLLRSLSEELKKLAENKSLRALFITSRKPGIFIAGADVREIENITSVDEAKAIVSAGQGIINQFEDMPFPTVALVNGTCLGGGLELALACDYRFAAFGTSHRIGLPEVKLGIVPGFGGSWRLPRQTGLLKGVELIIQGDVLAPEKAFRFGIVDGVTTHALLYSHALGFLASRNFAKRAPAVWKMPLPLKILMALPGGRAFLSWKVKGQIMKKTRGQYPSPLAAAELVIRNFGRARQPALDEEARVFGRLAAAGGHRKLIHVFYLTEKYKKEAWTSVQTVPIQRAGVLGAGIMGGGIAQVLSEAAIQVRMKDVNAEALQTGLKSASKVYVELVQRRKLSSYQADTLMGLILPTLDYSGFKRCQMVIEAVVESMEVKKKVLAEVASHVDSHCVLATNTSALSVTEMASVVPNPERVVGMHFFNPVHRMPLVEVIRGEKTSDEAVEAVVQLTRRIRKTPVVVKDTRGFLVNRLLMPYLNEAGHLLEEGAGLEQIDKALLDFGMPMGAFILLDEIGLDVAYKVAHTLEEAFGGRMKSVSLFSRLVERKWLGRKTGKGFYLHAKKKRVINPEIRDMISVKSAGISSEEIVSRCVWAMVNEASRCLEEGVCRSASDVDIAMIMGTGFPPFRGGLLRYADDQGPGRAFEELERLQNSVDPVRFEPSTLIQKLKASSQGFYSRTNA